jgi:hypothetical protein
VKIFGENIFSGGDHSGRGYSEMRNWFEPGTDVMILKIFSPKKLAKKLAFLTQNKAKF